MAAIEDDSYMSYCSSDCRSEPTDAAVPIVVPTFILPLVRQVFEDAYGKSFAEIMRTVDDYSQFDSACRMASRR